MSASKPMIQQAIVGAVFSLSLLSSYSHASLAQPAPLFDINIETGMGNSQGTLVWNISGGDGGPNILSELTYKDVKFVEYYGSANIHIRQGWLKDYDIFMDYSSGVAIDGSVQDSDYDGNNRSQEYSRSQSSAEDSKMRQFNFGIAYPFHLTHNQKLRAMAAYVYSEQNMVMTDGVQVLDTSNPLNIGPFRGALNSHYLAEWQGGWLGLEWALQSKHHHLALSAKQYLLDYHAVADWNLRSDFAHPKSFEQWAVGSGTGLSLYYGFSLSENFSLWLNWTQETWSTDPGQDKVYFADGSIGTTQLNEVSWDSSGLTTGLVVKF